MQLPLELHPTTTKETCKIWYNAQIYAQKLEMTHCSGAGHLVSQFSKSIPRQITQASPEGSKLLTGQLGYARERCIPQLFYSLYLKSLATNLLSIILIGLLKLLKAYCVFKAFAICCHVAYAQIWLGTERAHPLFREFIGASMKKGE